MIRAGRLALLLGLLGLLGLLAGCELFVDIPNGKLAGENDAPLGDCTTGEVVCEGATQVCKLDTATCVECDTDDACTDPARPFCNLATSTCDMGCTADAQCESGACLPDGTCAEVSRIKYAAPAGIGDCTRASPCAITDAVMQLADGIDVIQLETGTYSLAATLRPTSAVTFNGTDVTLQLLGGGTIVQYAGIAVALHRLTLDSPGGIAVFCQTSGKLTAKGVRIDGASAAIIASPCESRIDRSRFSLNTTYAMLLNGGPVTLTNSYITKNGVNSTFGGILLDNLDATSVIEHNTIADNTNTNTMTNPSGIRRCTGTFSAVIRNNIIRGNSIAPECVVSNNVIDAGYTGTGLGNLIIDPVFVDPANNDYHLVPSSPVKGLSDPTAQAVFVDFDGDPRPADPDPGADEIP